MTSRETVLELIGAWQRNDALRAGGFFAIEGRYLESGRDPLQGRDAIVAHFTRFFREGPPWRIEVDDVVADGDRVAVAYRFATKGKDSAWNERAGCAFVRLHRGLVEEWREYHG